MGNLRSVEKAFEKVGADAEITSDPEAADAADGVVLPGVGAFPKAMERGSASSGSTSCRGRGSRRGARCSGICLGMQLLFDDSTENEGDTGLGLMEGAGRAARRQRVQGPAHRLVAGSLGARLRADRGPRARAALLLRPLVRAAPGQRRPTCSAPPPTASASRAPSSARRSTESSSTPRSRARRAWRCSRTSRASALDPLPGDRHPRRPRRPAGAGRLRPRDRVRRRPGRRGDALGAARARPGSTWSTSTAPARASRRTSTTCAGSSRPSGSRSSSAAACATRARSRRRSRPGSSASCSAPPPSATPTSPRRSPRPTATASSRPSTPGPERSPRRGGPSRRPITPADLATALAERGIQRFIYTPVEVDGMMEGPDLDSLREVAAATDAEIIYSGGDRHARPPAGARLARPRERGRRDRRPGALRGAVHRSPRPRRPGCWRPE